MNEERCSLSFKHWEHCQAVNICMNICDNSGSVVQDADLNVITEDELAHLCHIGSVKPLKWWLQQYFQSI